MTVPGLDDERRPSLRVLGDRDRFSAAGDQPGHLGVASPLLPAENRVEEAGDLAERRLQVLPLLSFVPGVSGDLLAQQR